MRVGPLAPSVGRVAASLQIGDGVRSVSAERPSLSDYGSLRLRRASAAGPAPLFCERGGW